MRLLVAELQQVTGAKFRPGAARFEALLEVCGLSGPVDEDVQRDLIELANVRNVILHRMSTVDDRFVAACPWTNLTVGSRLKVTNADYDRYRNAVFNYLTAVNVRMRTRWLGMEVTDFPVASPDGHTRPNKKPDDTE